MEYRIQKIIASSGLSANNYYLILNNHDCFVAKFYSEFDAEICLEALKNYGAPADQTNNSASKLLICSCGADLLQKCVSCSITDAMRESH